jgi:tripartite-type tricarboxylate transporter receptor subunit TctC
MNMARDHSRENSDMLVRIASLVLSVWAFALPASAADYPDHAIKMVVPFAAGGGTDVLARIIAQNLNSKWGQPVVVENQPGASGGIGTRVVMKAPPDGYTLLMASTGALMAVSSGAGGEARSTSTSCFLRSLSPRRRPICLSRARPCRLPRRPI